MSQNDFDKQVSTTFSYNGVEYEFDIRDADDAEKFEKALDALKVEEAKAPKTGKLSEVNRAQCAMIKHFFDVCLADGASEAIFGGKDKLNACYDAYQKFLAMVSGQKDSLLKAKNAFSQHSNRQQRRHPNGNK